jgi:exopolysaccharide production protein ExoQ
MVPLIAAAVCLAFMAHLFRKDFQRADVQPISWVPLIWMFLAGSRWVSSWLNLSGPLASVDAYSEGSPVDRAVFFSLIVWGMVVLSQRNIEWERLFAQNKLIGLYLLFCLASIGWTDEPMVLFKRWFKDLGGPIMALVLLTERQPYQAVGTTLRRLSYLLLPPSMLFVRYFPHLGRGYRHDGSPLYTGVGHQKNDLGLMCLTAGIYFAWHMLRKENAGEAITPVNRYVLLLAAMLAYLLYLSNSQTSLVCLVIATGILVLSRVKLIASQPSRIVAVLAITALAYYVLDSTLHVKDEILAMLGRDADLTDRAGLWELVLSLEANPIVGAGFMSFWTGQRMETIWNALGAGINQAHNGYLEQYLNLGYVGVGFIIAIIGSGLLSVRAHLKTDSSAGLIRLCFISVAILYNYTEAAFYGINNMWVMLLLGCFDTRGVCVDTAAAPAAARTAATAQPRRPVPVPTNRPAFVPFKSARQSSRAQ